MPTPRGNKGDSQPPPTEVESLPIMNTILAYCVCKLDKTTKDTVKTMIVSSFPHEEIMEAKLALWKECSQHLDDLKIRKTTSDRTNIEANTDDILSAIQTLDAENKMPTICCDARDIDRFPTGDPEECLSFGIVERLNNLERQFKNHQEQLDRQTAMSIATRDKLDEIHKRIPGFSWASMASSNFTTLRNPTQSAPTFNNSAPRNPTQNAVSPRRPNDPASPERNNNCSTQSGQTEARTRTSSIIQQSTSASHSPEQNPTISISQDEFELPRDQRRRDQRRARRMERRESENSTENLPRRPRQYRKTPVVEGQRESTRLRQGPPVKRSVMIYNMDKDTTADMILEDLKDQSIENCTVEHRPDPRWETKSFIVTFPKDMMETMLSPSIWTKGSKVKKFFFDPRKKEAQ